MYRDVACDTGDHAEYCAVFVAVFPVESEDDGPDEGGFESSEGE